MKTALTCLSLSLLALSACEDPAVAQRKQAELRLSEASAAILRAAQQASMDRVAAAEDLRGAAARAQSIPGATAAQQQTASALVASARTQAALLELGRLNQLESSNRANRSLALALMRAAEAMHSHVAAHDKGSVVPAKDGLSPLSATATSESRELAQAEDALLAEVNALRKSNQAALEQAEMILAQAEETRQRGLQAGPGEIMVIAIEAGKQRDEAREFQGKAASGEVDLTERETSLRLQASEAESARRRAEVVRRALSALDAIVEQYEAASVEGTSVISNLTESTVTLVAVTDPAKNEAWAQGIERLFGDLDAADSAAGQAQGAIRLNASVARARALMAQGDAIFQQALLLHHLSESDALGSATSAMDAQAQTLLGQARDKAREAHEAYTAVKEAISASGDGSSQMAALAATIDAAIAAIGTPSFDVAARGSDRKRPTAPAAAAAPRDADGTADAPTVDEQPIQLPPFSTAEDLAAYLSGGAKSPEAMMRMGEVFSASTPDAEAMKAMTVGIAEGFGGLLKAMKDKFGSASLGPGFDQMMAAAAGSATLTESGETEATISLAQPTGEMIYKVIKTDEGWKVDLDATVALLPEEQRAQMLGAQAMMTPLIAALAEVTAKVESGEISSAEQVQMALKMAMQGSAPEGG